MATQCNEMAFITIEENQILLKSDIVEIDGKYHIEYELSDDEQCLYCHCVLTPENTCVFDVTSNDYEDSKPFCKICTTALLRDMNRTIADGTGIELCFNCAVPHKYCKCSAKKIDRKLRRKMR